MFVHVKKHKLAKLFTETAFDVLLVKMTRGVLQYIQKNIYRARP